MGDRIEVRLGELSDSAAAVRRAAEGTAECSGRIRGLSAAGSATGNPSCAASFEAMVGLWADQLIFSAEEVAGLSRATEGARSGYEANEAAIASDFDAGEPR